MGYLYFILYSIGVVFFISFLIPSVNIFFNFKILRNYRKIRFDSEYFRDILSYSPSEVLYIYNKNYKKINPYGVISKYKKMFYINLLKMNLLGYVNIDFSKGDNFEIIKSDVIILEKEYKLIYDYIFTYVTNDSKLMLSDINDHVEHNYENNSFFRTWDKLIRNNLKMRGFYSTDFITVLGDDIKKYYSVVIPILIIIDLFFLITNPYFGKFLLFSFLVIGAIGYFDSKNVKITSNRYVYEYKKIRALKKFLKDFTIIEDRSIEYIKILEDYVVYSAIFDMYDLPITEIMKEIRLFLESN